MKKFLITIGLLLASTVGMGQTVHTAGRETDNTFTGANQFTQPLLAGPLQVAALPTASSLPGRIVYVSDGVPGSNPCVNGGTGAIAESLNNIWSCGATGGVGTITGVLAGTNLTGGGLTGAVTLNVDTTKVVTGIFSGTGLTGGGTGGNQTLSVTPNGITNALAAQMPATTLKGNNTGSTANAIDLTVNQVNTLLGNTSQVNGATCPALTDACFTGVFANNTTVVVTSGIFTISNQINIVNVQHGKLLCYPGVRMIASPTANIGQMVQISAGTYDFSIEGCDIGGASVTLGTVAVAHAGITLTGTGTSFTSAMANGTGWASVLGAVPGGSALDSTGMCIAGFTSGTSLTVSNSLPCGGGLPNSFGGSSVSAAPYHISWGTMYAIKVTSQTCSITSIAGNGSVVSVSVAGGCILTTGQQVDIYNTGIIGTRTSYNIALTPLITVTGCTGAACSFTYPSTTSIGSGSSGTVGIGPTNVRLVHNYIHDVFVQGISMASDSTDPYDPTSNVTAEGNTVEWCGAACIVASRMVHAAIINNTIRHPDSRGGGGACFDFQQVRGGRAIGNDCGSYAAAIAPNQTGYPATHTVFDWGLTIIGNTVHDVPPTTGVSSGINMHIDTCVDCTITGNVIGQLTAMPNADSTGNPVAGTVPNASSGGVGIRCEVCQNATMGGNSVANTGWIGIFFNSRLEATGSQTNGVASCVVAACTTPSGHQIWSADDQSSHAFTAASTGAGGNLTGFTVQPVATGTGVACTSATTPACTIDTVTKTEGVASQRICPVQANCATAPSALAFSAGVIASVQLDCTSVGGSALCTGSNPSTSNLLTLPVFRFAIRSPSVIAAGDFQLLICSQINCVAPEYIRDIPQIRANAWTYLEFIPENWTAFFDVPGVRTIAIAAKSGGTASTYTNIWLDDFAFDVPGRQAHNVITGNTIYHSGGNGISTSGGSNDFVVSGNTIFDPGWDSTYGVGSSYGIYVDGGQSGSQLVKGPPYTGGIISGNYLFSDNLNANLTCIGLGAYNGGTIDSVRVDYTGCSGSWPGGFLDPNVGSTRGLTSPVLATNYAYGVTGSTLTVKRGTAGCATAASIGATCTTVVTFANALFDTAYTINGCTGNAITSGVPIIQGVTAKSATTITVQTVALTAAAAQFTNIECTASHD